MNKNKTAQSILNAIDEFENFIIAGHKEPDADCLCSQLAISSFLNRKGKKTTLISAGPFNRPEIKHLQRFFTDKLTADDVSGKTLAIITDCSSIDRTGKTARYIENLPLMVIDHHSSGDCSGKYRYIDRESPSTTLLVQSIIETSGDKPTAEEAEYIFLGFCTDTGFFRHIGPGKPEIFEAVSRLVSAGISPNKTHRLITGGRSHGSRRLLGRILDRASLHHHEKLIISWEYLEDRKELDTVDRDSDSLYQMLQSIENIEAVALIREQEPNLFSIGLRSNNDTDVGSIAKSFGGGGHQKAAGCTLTGTKEEVEDKIILSFNKYFQ